MARGTIRALALERRGLARGYRTGGCGKGTRARIGGRTRDPHVQQGWNEKRFGRNETIGKGLIYRWGTGRGGPSCGWKWVL